MRAFTFCLFLCVGVLLAGETAAEEPYQIAWVRQFGTTGHDAGYSVSADGLGNIYTSGWVWPNLGSQDAVLSKYSAAGNLLWTRQLGIGGMTITGCDASSGVSADGLGNVYISGTTAGSLGGPSSGSLDAFLAKYDAAGNVLWVRQLGTSGDDIGYSVSADGLGNVYMSGYTTGGLGAPNAGGFDAFVSKYDAAGNVLWTAQLGTSSDDPSYGVSADRLGNVYISGFTTGSLGAPNAGNYDAFLTKYNDAGTHLWSRQLGTETTDWGCGVSADALGNVYISGYTGGSLGAPNAGGYDAFATKYDAAGNVLWRAQLGTSGDDHSYGVSADGLGNVYMSGTSRGSDPFVSKYSGSGTLLWTSEIGPSGSGESYGVSADRIDTVYVCGETQRSLGGPNAGWADAWVARLSGAPSNVVRFEVTDPPSPSVERLAKWDGTGWVPVRRGELSSGEIHVLVHGWGPGLRAFADAGGKIWQAEAQEYKKVAEAFGLAAPGHLIVAFNWLDKSATETVFEPWKSRAETDEMGAALAAALRQAFGEDSTFDGKLHLLGISHGARVATLAAAELYNQGEEGSVVVDHLTLADSPEGPGPWFAGGVGERLLLAGAANRLDPVLRDDKQLNIGRADGTTFVDNYYSFWGRAYSEKLFGLFGESDIVNVELVPDESWDLEAKHRYPLDWYRDATVFSRSLALGWSPLLRDAYKTLASDYRQDWEAGEFFLKEVDTGEPYPIELRSDMQLATIVTGGSVDQILGGVRLTEASSAYWHGSFTMEPDDVAMEFTYQFLGTGDGDQLGLWLDGELRFIMTGQLIDTDARTSVLDISDLTPGYHILSVALHSYGEANSIVEVRDLTLLSVPEPCSFALFATGALAVLAHLRRKGRRGCARLAE